MPQIPFQTIDWETIEPTEHEGDAGTSYWRTLEFNGLRIRMVEYSKGYVANHWCEKGHIIYCIEGEFLSELQNGEQYVLSSGMSYVVSDKLSCHRSSTKEGVRLLIVDGDFLK